MPLEGKRELKQGKVYMTEVCAQDGDVLKQIADQLTNDTALIEQSDFVLVANQKNKTKKPLAEG